MSFIILMSRAIACSNIHARAGLLCPLGDIGTDRDIEGDKKICPLAKIADQEGKPYSRTARVMTAKMDTPWPGNWISE